MLSFNRFSSNNLINLKLDILIIHMQNYNNLLIFFLFYNKEIHIYCNKHLNYHGFEFLKYHIFDGGTLFNAIPMFSGVNLNNKNKIISIVKDMKNLGYITCNVQDVC